MNNNNRLNTTMKVEALLLVFVWSSFKGLKVLFACMCEHDSGEEAGGEGTFKMTVNKSGTFSKGNVQISLC